MDIYVLNQDNERLDIIDTYQSAIWHLKYYDAGEFELYIAADDYMIQLLRKGNRLIRYDRTARSIELVTIDGEPDESPEPPEATQTTDIYDLVIADVLVKAGTDGITDDDIIDRRSYVTFIPAAAKVNYRRYKYNHTSKVTEIPVPDHYGYTFDTNLQIYINGVLADVDDYTIELTEDTDSGYKIVFNNTLNADTRIEAVMIS